MAESRTLALVMAGGQSRRMRESGIDVPKPLVQVLGVPLFERNLHSVLRANVDGVVVSVPIANQALRTWIGKTIATYEAATRVPMELLVEEKPLGNIGCAARLAGKAEQVIVVFGDNLTTLDLHAMLIEHRRAGADLTLAIHEHRFRMPFGEVQLSNARVTAYVEKPTYSFQVCSGIAVLGKSALAALHEQAPVGLSDLAAKLIASGCGVLAHAHSTAWIDVNTASDLCNAEQLVTLHQREFDLWAGAPRIEARSLTVRGGKVRLEPTARTSDTWTLPAANGRLTNVPAERAHAASNGKPACTSSSFAFDDIGGPKGNPLRIEVLVNQSNEPALRDRQWWDLAEAARSAQVDRTAARAISIFMHRNEASVRA